MASLSKMAHALHREYELSSVPLAERVFESHSITDERESRTEGIFRRAMSSLSIVQAAPPWLAVHGSSERAYPHCHLSN